MVQSGQVLAGRYELRSRLGRGGMAEVWRARDPKLDREVAVKILAAERAEGGFLRRFQREAQSAASLNHRNVVAIYDTGEDDGHHYIVMELIDGPTLEQVLAEEGPLDPARATDIAIKVTAALEAAYARDLVHRDIKPANIMFDADGEVRVADFGLARAVDSTTRTSTVYGSAPYMSPEHARGDDVDARTDLYALGCVLYEMLTGRPPFTGENAVSIVYQHLQSDPDPASQLRSGVPAELDAVLAGLLAKDREQRYPDAETLRDDLQRVRDGRPPLFVDLPDDAGRTKVLDTGAATVALGAAGAQTAATRAIGGGGDGGRAAAAGAGAAAGGAARHRERVVDDRDDRSGAGTGISAVAVILLTVIAAVVIGALLYAAFQALSDQIGELPGITGDEEPAPEPEPEQPPQEEQPEVEEPAPAPDDDDGDDGAEEPDPDPDPDPGGQQGEGEGQGPPEEPPGQQEETSNGSPTPDGGAEIGV